MEVIQQTREFFHPCVECPQLRMFLDITLAAPNLIVGDDLSVSQLCQGIQHLEIVVRRARSAMQQHQRCTIGLLSYDAIERLKALEGHVTCLNLHFTHLIF